MAIEEGGPLFTGARRGGATRGALARRRGCVLGPARACRRGHRAALASPGAAPASSFRSVGHGVGRRGPAVPLSSETSDAETDKTSTSSSSTAEVGDAGASLEGLTPAEAVKVSKAAKDQVKFSVTKGITEDDLQAMQKYAESEGIERIFRGAFIEARLIEWPGPPEVRVETEGAGGKVAAWTPWPPAPWDRLRLPPPRNSGAVQTTDARVLYPLPPKFFRALALFAQSLAPPGPLHHAHCNCNGGRERRGAVFVEHHPRPNQRMAVLQLTGQGDLTLAITSTLCVFCTNCLLRALCVVPLHQRRCPRHPSSALSP